MSSRASGIIECAGPETVQKAGLYIDKPPPGTGISRMVCDELLSGCESKHLSDPVIKTNPLGIFVRRYA